jgi:hypothetical protein
MPRGEEEVWQGTKYFLGTSVAEAPLLMNLQKRINSACCQQMLAVTCMCHFGLTHSFLLELTKSFGS